MIELLLVLAIIGIVAGVTLPSLVNSIRGNRLRFAARSVVMAGRYARSMAVMKQMDMALRFNLDSGKLSVAAVESGTPPVEEEPGVTEAGRAWDEADGEGLSARVSVEGAQGGTVVGNGKTKAVGAARPTVMRSVELERSLGQVAIKRVQINGFEEEVFTSGIGTVIYRTNGTCTPYRVEVEDASGSGIFINVDTLSSAEVEARR